MLQRLLTKRQTRIFIILGIFLALISLNILSVFSQEPSPSEEPSPVPTEIPTEQPSATPVPPTETATATLMEPPSPTATNTEPPSPTATEALTETMVASTETPTETPTLLLTETPTASLEVTASATPTGTFTPTPTSGLPTSTPIGQTPSFLNPSKPNTSFSPFSIVPVPVDSVSELIDALANADCGDETVIEMDSGTPLYTLTDVYDSSFFGNNGLPIIECNVTINGNGTTLTRSVNADPFRLFGVDSGATLTINDLALTNGKPSETGGGAILSVGGAVNVNRSYILNNTIDFETGWQTLGAGIYVYYGDLTITDSEIAGNHNFAGNESEDLGDGGGIASINGTVIVSGVAFHDNMVSRDGSAAAILDNSTEGAHINDSCIVGNDDISVFANWGLDADSNWWGNAAGPLVDLPSTGTRDSVNAAVAAGAPLSTPPSCGAPPPQPTSTPSSSPTPTFTPTPTYAPSTSLDLNGQHSGLKAVMFWAIFRESNLDAVDSGSSIDNDLGNPRFSSFLFDTPYCSPNSGTADNAAEPPPPSSPSQDWYIRHCPYDYRYMAAQTMLNGFLNYERRYGISHVFEYASVNFSGSIGSPNIGLWSLDSQCVTNIGSTYSSAFAASSSGNNYAPALTWLDSYTTCIATSSSTDYKVLRAKRAYNSTVFSQVASAVTDFYAIPQDYTDAAFQAKVVSFSSTRTAVTCVGGCYINNNLSTVVYTYEAPQDTFNAFATPLNNITQTDVDNAYATHMQQISTYSGDFHSVAQPVFIYSYDTNNGSNVGYVWETEIYQQAGDMSHDPR